MSPVPSPERGRRLGSLLPAALLVGLPAGPSPAQERQGAVGASPAPDGQPGLGANATAQEILGLFRTPTEEQEAFLASLADLRGDLLVLVANVEGLYHSRGWFDLLQPSAEPTLANLHTAFAALLEQPAALSELREDAAEAFAGMFFDVRYRVRQDLIADSSYELSELDRALTVLRAAGVAGQVHLADPQARNVARRGDLAAARLRAMRYDLEAVREQPGDDEAAPPLALPAKELIGRLGSAGPGQLRSGLGGEIARQERAVERMRAFLFTTQLDERAEKELAWRAQADARAAIALQRALAALPGNDEQYPPPEELEGRSNTQRRRVAWGLAEQGLEDDPLEPELAYVAAVVSRMLGDTLVTLSHYDRFLVLNGILSYDDRTFRDRELTWEQEDALIWVQEWSPKPDDTGPPGSE